MNTNSNLSHLGLSFLSNECEMYSNSDCKEKEKENTFHITGDEYSVVNVCSALPIFSPSEAPAAGVTREGERVTKREKESFVPRIRHVSSNDIYTDVLVQMSEPKGSDKVIRTTAYISLMPDDTDRYEIKLSCNLTTRTDETLRSAEKNGNNALMSVIQSYRNKYPGVMLGRCRYTRIKNSYSAEFKKNLSSALLAVWMDEEGEMMCEFYLLGEFFPMEQEDLSESQMKYYKSQFGYHADVGEID